MLVNCPGVACIYSFYKRVVLQLYRLSAVYAAWYLFDPRYFHVCCTSFSNSVVYFIISIHSSWQSASKIYLSTSSFVVSLWWRAHRTAFYVQDGAQSLSICDRLSVRPYLSEVCETWPIPSCISSLLRNFCHQHKKLIQYFSCILVLVCNFLRLYSVPWKRYLIEVPSSQSSKAYVSMAENVMLKSLEPVHSIPLLRLSPETVQSTQHHFGPLQACHHGVVVPLLWTLSDSQS